MSVRMWTRTTFRFDRELRPGGKIPIGIWYPKPDSQVYIDELTITNAAFGDGRNGKMQFYLSNKYGCYKDLAGPLGGLMGLEGSRKIDHFVVEGIIPKHTILFHCKDSEPFTRGAMRVLKDVMEHMGVSWEYLETLTEEDYHNRWALFTIDRTTYVQYRGKWITFTDFSLVEAGLVDIAVVKDYTPQEAGEHIPKYICSVCAEEYTDPNELSRSADVPIFREEDGEPVDGFTSSPTICGACRVKHGVPTKILHRPYRTDLCVFVSGKVVEMKGSGPKD